MGQGSQELIVTVKIGGKPVRFLVDSGVAYSVLKQDLQSMKSQRLSIPGVTGKTASYTWTTIRTVDLGQGIVTYSFLDIPDCPYPLLGMDLFQKLRTTNCLGEMTWGKSFSRLRFNPK